jgi:hypothetical protein
MLGSQYLKFAVLKLLAGMRVAIVNKLERPPFHDAPMVLELTV